MTPIAMTLNALKVTFSVFNLSNSHASLKYSTYYLLYVYTCIRKRMWPVIALLKVEDFLRLQAVTYTVKVVISRKRCRTKTLLIQISLIGSDMSAYQSVADSDK